MNSLSSVLVVYLIYSKEVIYAETEAKHPTIRFIT